VRVVKLVLVSGTTQDCSGGQPASGGGVAAERKDRRRNLGRRHGAIEWLGVHDKAVTYRQAINFIAAIELRRACIGATPSANGGADHGSRSRIYRDNIRAENAADSRRRSGQGERIGWKHAPANRSDVDEIG
jgi:hypothetical protein